MAGVLVVACMVVLKWIKPEGVWRQIALALGSGMVLRYVYWRTAYTLPPISQWEYFIPAITLYLAEMYSVAMFALSLFAVIDPLPSRKPPSELDDEALPTVDVFVPSYNESDDLLATTLAAAKAMDYPAEKLMVWLLDDGGTDQKCEAEDATAALAAQNRRARLQALCESMGVQYLTRARNEHAKAGNLNNGLAYSTADLVAVFDADHAPTRDFLSRTVGYFSEDLKLFLVQTPHFFINPDPVERNLVTFDSMPSENEMFYGLIQRGLDRWNAAFFCGSAALLRREALNDTSGFSGVSVTEDCETALDLHSRGWRSLYVDRPLVAGLQPTTFAEFIGQRTRWAQGMLQILLLKWPFFKRGLTFPQRLCYASSTLFWMFPFARMIFLISPLFYLFFSLKIFNSSGSEFLAYVATYMIINILMQNYLYSKYRWPWFSELYEYIQGVYLIRPLISVFGNPYRPTFRVTSKDESRSEGRISELATPFYVIFAVLSLAVVATVWRLITQPYDTDITLVVGGWNLFNLVIVGCALGVVSERRDLRKRERIEMSRRCEIFVEGKSIPGTIIDASTGGVQIRVPAAEVRNVKPEDVVELQLGRSGTIDANKCLEVIVRGSQSEEGSVLLGCSVHATTADEYSVIADMVFSDSDRWVEFQERRRVEVGAVRGTLRFLGIASYQTGRGLLYLVMEIGNFAAKKNAPAGVR